MTGSHRRAARRVSTSTVRLGLAAGLIVVLGALLVEVALDGDHLTPSGRLAAQRSSSTAATVSTAPIAIPSPPATPSATSTAAAARASTPKPTSSAPPLTYTVQPGDNLTVIAAWFKLHGYGDLYEANKAVLGDDPDLIHPGQKITISGVGMTTGG